MLYEIAHIVKDKFGFIWEIVEHVNASLFALRYRDKLKHVNELLSSLDSKYTLRQTSIEDTLPLVKFFDEQPEDAFKYFRPHKFDETSVRKILQNKAFQTFVVTDETQIIGYFFLRSFINGKCFYGLMSDYRARGKGIGKLMAKAFFKVSEYESLSLFASVAPENHASMESIKAVCDVQIIKTLENGDYLIECFPKKDIEQ